MKRENRWRKGSILLTTLILLTIAVFISVSLLKFIIEINHIDQKRIDQIKAFYVAEGGVEIVLQCFNNPDYYTPDQTLFIEDTNDDGLPDLRAKDLQLGRLGGQLGRGILPLQPGSKLFRPEQFGDHMIQPRPTTSLEQPVLPEHVGRRCWWC